MKIKNKYALYTGLMVGAFVLAAMLAGCAEPRKNSCLYHDPSTGNVECAP